MEFEDKTINCVDCASPFVHSAADQARYAERGLGHEPKRCPGCRAKRRSQGGGGGGAPAAGGAPGNERSSAPAGPRGRAGRFFSATQDARGGRREFFPATCAACGKETTVPFRPVEGRPVYCRDCFQDQKGEGGNRQ
jgi:CxxC-x17-CxxC domain-containing protein